MGGLPQGNFASDRLADTYADTLLRKLRRRGLAAWRYSDDFRIGASTYQDGINALEIFDEELRSMGLFVNERKTHIVHRDKYIDKLGREREYFTDAWREKRDELTTIDFYSFEPVVPDDPDVFGAVAIDELRAWAQAAKVAREDDKSELPTRLDLSLVLNILSLVQEPQALEHIPELLLMEPQHTYQVANYLYELSETHAAGVDAAVSKTIENTALSKWISVWLSYALSNPNRENGWPGRVALAPEVKRWLTTLTSSQDEVLSSYAAWALAVTGSLTQDIWSRLNKRPGSYSSQFAAAALAGLPAADRNSLDSGDNLDKIIREWAESVV